MPLELATRLILRTAEDGSPLPASRVRQIAASWADVPAAATELVEGVQGRGGSRVTTRDVQLGDGRIRWDLLLSRADEEDDSVKWIVELTGLFEPDRTTVAARLRRDSSDHRLRPLAGSPAPPRVIRDILAATDIASFDGPIRTQPYYRRISVADVEGLVEVQLTATDRRLPIVAVSKGAPKDNTIDIKRLARALAGFAHVLLVDREVLPVLGREIENLSLAPGCVRTWWSGLALDDESTVHPVLTLGLDDPDRAVDALREEILSVARDRWREPGRIVQFDRGVRQARDEAGRAASARVVDELEQLRVAAAADRERGARASAAAAPTVDIETYETRLAEMSTDVAKVNQELQRQRELAETAEALLEESEDVRARLEQERRSLSGRVEGLEAQLDGRARAAPRGLLTQNEMFAEEVRESWGQRLTPDDRQRYELAEFVIREDFVATIAAAGADRGKVVATVMEVACGYATEMGGRQVHRLRRGASGNAPVRQRSRDGAVAWRCNIQSNAASARRLHYWACPGATFEFVSVVVHDDFAIKD